MKNRSFRALQRVLSLAVSGFLLAGIGAELYGPALISYADRDAMETETDGIETIEATEETATEVETEAETEAETETQLVETTTDNSTPLLMRDLTAEEIVHEMGTGWNLGNTMDGHTGLTPNETLWQNTVTTKATIKAVHDMGFQTIRVPVTYGTTIKEDYSIDEQWLGRVQDIVDYAIDLDMYVIINIHHDGAEQSGWIHVASEDPEPMYEKFEGVWTTLATRFANYDEHLIFESMNEITGGDNSTEGIKRDTEVINELNQIFVDTVRKTGGNNANRWLSVPGRYTNIGWTTSNTYGFTLPKDSASHKLFVSVHYYDWQFGMKESMEKTTFTKQDAESLETQFLPLKQKFTEKGVPVILGEYGCINKNNSEDRAYHCEVVNYICKSMGIVPVYWDQGWYDRSEEPADYSFSLVDRETNESIDKAVTDALMRGMYLNYSSLADITKSPEITEITAINISDGKILDGQIELAVGKTNQLVWATLPEKTNDVVLWKSENESIATVSRGFVTARGIGETTVYAYSQSGSVTASVKVIVYNSKYTTACKKITFGKEQYDLILGEHAYLEATMAPETTDCQLAFQSADESIVTVNRFGRLVAVSTGETYVIATASNGVTSYVKVSVKEKELPKVLRLALNVLYNDSALSCWNNEVGPTIEVSGNGQYTVSFDCALDLSDETRAVGIESIKNLTAIYIKDQDVTEGISAVSNLESCMITYDSVKVNGEELTITKTEPKNAMKASGIFDTNDPINAWDGSAVAEVTARDHVANFEMEDVTTVEVTFTLSDFVFKTSEAEEEKGTFAITSKTPSDFKLLKDERSLVTVAVTENGVAKAGSRVTFIPEDAAIAYVTDTSVVTDEKGYASCEVAGVVEGTTLIDVLTEDGKLLKLTVTVMKEKEKVETGKNDETTVAETTTAPYVETPEEKQQNIMTMVLLAVPFVVILLFLGIGIFIISSAGRKK